MFAGSEPDAVGGMQTRVSRTAIGSDGASRNGG